MQPDDDEFREADADDTGDVDALADAAADEETPPADADDVETEAEAFTDELVVDDVVTNVEGETEPSRNGSHQGGPAQTSFLEPVQPSLIDTGDLERSIEALLFVCSEPLSIKAIGRLTGVDEKDVAAALAALGEHYAERGIVIREVGGGYRFASAPIARAAVEAYLLPPKSTLSPAALETLAIVAYQQPVTKGEIEAIRGVNVDGVVANLVDRRFIAESGRKEVAGRPILFKTTADFLEAFGLRSLEELPAIDFEPPTPLEPVLPIEEAPSPQPATP